MLDSYTWQAFFFAPFGDRLGLNNIISSQLWLTGLSVRKSGWGLALQMRLKEDQVTSLCLRLVYHVLLDLIWDSINQVFNTLFLFVSEFRLPPTKPNLSPDPAYWLFPVFIWPVHSAWDTLLNCPKIFIIEKKLTSKDFILKKGLKKLRHTVNLALQVADDYRRALQERDITWYRLRHVALWGAKLCSNASSFHANIDATVFNMTLNFSAEVVAGCVFFLSPM